MVCELPACIAMWIKWSCSYYGIIDLLTLFVSTPAVLVFTGYLLYVDFESSLFYLFVDCV